MGGGQRPPTPLSRRRPWLASDARRALAKARRNAVPRASHAEFAPRPDRPDPIATLLEQAVRRVPQLVAVRHGRMLASPLAFFRGAAATMAWDLAGTPSTGFLVQADGDAHLLNFGVYASPERRMLFDLNDFDETLPAPWEWDVKRLAASVAIAGRSNGLGATKRRDAVVRALASYRATMARLSGMSVLEVWYLEVEAPALPGKGAFARDVGRTVHRARVKDSRRAFSTFTEVVDGRWRFRSQPPLLLRLDELLSAGQSARFDERVRANFGVYRRSLREEYRHLIDHYRLHDVAFKVVGTGSVGTRCVVALLAGVNGHPLVLQGKEAQPSVLAPHLGRSRYRNQGQRVVVGQRLLQAASDVFLGWAHDQDGRDYYWRQLWDMKGSFEIETMSDEELCEYAAVCGQCLARAHARSGDAIVLSAYMGTSDRFDHAIAAFAEAYADQNDRDYAALKDAVRQGRVQAQPTEAETPSR